MQPRVVIISGSEEPRAFSLGEGETIVGREAAEGIQLEDSSVSRQHCRITREGGGARIVDLGSHNGTFVNEVPVREHSLAHGDRIKVGKSLLLFLVEDPEEAPDAEEVQLTEGPFLADHASRFSLEEALYSASRDLNVLMRISTVINSSRGLETLQRKLLGLLLDAVPADRGAVLLLREGTREFASGFSLGRDSEEGRPVGVSRTVAQEVAGGGVAVLSNDVLAGGMFSAAKSLMGSQVRALLCVPMTLFDRTVGIIYLDSADPSVRFDKGHLQFVTAAANIAAGALYQAGRVERLEAENQRLRDESDTAHNMVGESECMKNVYQLIRKVAATASTVLISGESGTGKELAARAVHQNSPRRKLPFFAVNCATLTEPLLESELFGHERGAFTGAVAQKKGKFELADGGTLFLDEVGELNFALQAKLLRVLQEMEFERLGGTRTIKVDVRVVAATNKDLRQLIKQGQFREDLFFRLNVVSLRMPPLRERLEDVWLLANYFAAKYAEKCKRQVTGISQEARWRLLGYSWPGNVRELENAIERAVALGSTDVILAEDLPETLSETEPAGEPGRPPKFHDLVREAKKRLVIEALRQSGGDFKSAADALGMHPNNLHRLVRNLNLRALLND